MQPRKQQHWRIVLLPLLVVVAASSARASSNQLFLSISAEKQLLEISWHSLDLHENATIVLTDAPTPDAAHFLYQLRPETADDWVTTDVTFDYRKFDADYVDANTTCYGYWLFYLAADREQLAAGCLRAYPRWMNELRDEIRLYRFRDLFIPGTHDSASYRRLFVPARNETLVTKYTLTQDESIVGQLLHGARYIDLRIGYYRQKTPQFWANHGISRQQPLDQVLRDIVDFTEATNEIVLVDLQEFPVGFGKDLAIHRKLVTYVRELIGDHTADLQDTWQARLEDIWAQGKRVIIGYDYVQVVTEFSPTVWMATQQRWANTAQLGELRDHLLRANEASKLRFSSRPVTDMAELTPDPWGVISDQYGGLRRLADKVNRMVSHWYWREFGSHTNVVAVDFLRGTTIVQAAIHWNRERHRMRGEGRSEVYGRR